jgi:hypothetical protein
MPLSGITVDHLVPTPESIEIPCKYFTESWTNSRNLALCGSTNVTPEDGLTGTYKHIFTPCRRNKLKGLWNVTQRTFFSYILKDIHISMKHNSNH